MAPPADPYRTLGLTRGASLDEVRRAYRRLAKLHHPDAGGEAAVPRFLAIRAAYEQIVGPGGGTTRSTSAARPAKPWSADPDRADATRRAYGGRSRRARPAPGTRSTPPPPGPAGADPTGAGSTGAGPTGDPAAGRSKKATLGSTSYDGADREPFDPDWGGASWYGTTSGTYWTINPKEYADPRKHGPEYQARARRKAAEAMADADEDRVVDSGADEAPTDAAADASPPTGADVGQAAEPTPTATTESWWDATAGPAAGVGVDGVAMDPGDLAGSTPSTGQGSRLGRVALAFRQRIRRALRS